MGTQGPWVRSKGLERGKAFPRSGGQGGAQAPEGLSWLGQPSRASLRQGCPARPVEQRRGAGRPRKAQHPSRPGAVRSQEGVERRILEPHRSGSKSSRHPPAKCYQTAARREGASAAVRSPPSAYEAQQLFLLSASLGRQGSCGSRPVMQRTAR